jgi:hypothetical protein
VNKHAEMSFSPQIQIVRRFNDALNAADLDGMMGYMTDDCVFENTTPAPDGERYEGQAAVRAFWQASLLSSSQAQIVIEEIFATDENQSSSADIRCVMLWRYEWVDLQDQEGHVRGVDVYRLRGDLIAEKLSYVKG